MASQDYLEKLRNSVLGDSDSMRQYSGSALMGGAELPSKPGAKKKKSKTHLSESTKKRMKEGRRAKALKVYNELKVWYKDYKKKNKHEPTAREIRDAKYDIRKTFPMSSSTKGQAAKAKSNMSEKDIEKLDKINADIYEHTKKRNKLLKKFAEMKV